MPPQNCLPKAAAPSAGMCAPKQALQNIRRKPCASAWKKSARRAGHSTCTPLRIRRTAWWVSAIKRGRSATCLLHSPPAAAALAQSCWILRAKTCGARPALAGRAGCKHGGHRPLPAHGLPAGWRAEHVPAGGGSTILQALQRACYALSAPGSRLNLRYSVGFSYRFCSLSTIRLKINW